MKEIKIFTILGIIEDYMQIYSITMVCLHIPVLAPVAALPPPGFEPNPSWGRIWIDMWVRMNHSLALLHLELHMISSIHSSLCTT
jgi:hypothetical protein